MANILGATEKELIESRLAKLRELELRGIDPYPEISDRDRSIAEVSKNSKDLIGSNEKVTVAGRITAKRGHGKLVFVDVVDESGKLQGVVKEDIVGTDQFKIFSLIDVVDFVEISGPLFITQAGELTVQIEKFRLLTKALRPLPDKWNGLKDTETRYRERYVDLIVNPEVKEKFFVRSRIIQSLRNFYIEKGFLEVDTPVLQPIAGGASAKPFKTHYNAYDCDVYLRIAPELYLKRLLVGGFEKVFEFARSFRNEGVDATHNPEFTNLEAYWAYADYEKMMKFVEEMIRYVVKEINDGKSEMEINGVKIDFNKPFKRVTFHELTKGAETDEAFKISIASISDPTFVTNHPTEMIPLAKRNKKNPAVVDTFQLVIAGIELVKAFSELNDPTDQRKRFEEQMKLRAKGDEEAQVMDDDFLKALEYGMPPTSGLGLGVDRFVRVMTNAKTLREILFFPFMKPSCELKEKIGRAKGTKVATVVLNNSSNLSGWQKMNTVAHLNVSFAGRTDAPLFQKDKIFTKDDQGISLNIQHAIMIREAETNNDLIETINKAKEEELEVFEFIRPMLTTSSDKAIEEDTKAKNLKEVEFLGVLVYGDKVRVDALTDKFPLVK